MGGCELIGYPEFDLADLWAVPVQLVNKVVSLG
jgi:hypothetical protein